MLFLFSFLTSLRRCFATCGVCSAVCLPCFAFPEEQEIAVWLMAACSVRWVFVRLHRRNTYSLGRQMCAISQFLGYYHKQRLQRNVSFWSMALRFYCLVQSTKRVWSCESEYTFEFCVCRKCHLGFEKLPAVQSLKYNWWCYCCVVCSWYDQ
jgi:hypothetical protein